MNLPSLLEHYGYAAVFVGTFLEGESMVVLGGYGAHRDLLKLEWVIAAAFAAALASDQLFYGLGRWQGERLLSRPRRWHAKLAHATRLIERHGVITVLVMRFMWGLRIALPFTIGMSGMSPRRYLALDVASAALWACTVALVGFGASRLAATLIDDLHRHEHWIIAGLIAVAVVVLARRWWPTPVG